MTDNAMLLAALDESIRQGPLGETAERAFAMGERFSHQIPPGVVVDLGAGGGVPGLVIGWQRPDVTLRMVERRATRADLLRRLVLRLKIDSRCMVTTADAADLGHDSEWRGLADAVTARSFGAPAVVAEAASALLCIGGLLLVAEPPDASVERWPTDELAILGLVDEGVVDGIRRLRMVAPCPPKSPRRRLNPPLFT
jgi:rRNA small subunit methyltransferase G